MRSSSNDAASYDALTVPERLGPALAAATGDGRWVTQCGSSDFWEEVESDV